MADGAHKLYDWIRIANKVRKRPESIVEAIEMYLTE
jgi:hypothetical protein